MCSSLQNITLLLLNGFSFCNQVFDGNTDQFIVVSHLLRNPIITRYIRIIPVTWNGGIGLRADFYGCKSGKRHNKL